MVTIMEFPKIWDIMEDFKEICRKCGWKTSENEDWVYANEDYHNFIWIRTIHHSTFRKVNNTQKCAIKEGTTYKVVDTAFTAWLFTQKPSEELINTLTETPDLIKRTALYDLSEIYQGKPVCNRQNSTSSVVFQKFEEFLGEMGIRVEQMLLSPLNVSKRNPEKFLVIT